MPTFKVTYERNVIKRQRAEIVVEAASLLKAEDIASALDHQGFSTYTDFGDVEVQNSYIVDSSEIKRLPRIG